MPNQEITFMWKDANSWTGDCPALYRTDGGYFVQVKKVTDPEVRARLEALGRANDSALGADEDFGFVPANVLDRIRDLCPQSVRISSRSCSPSPERRFGWNISASPYLASNRRSSTG
jgi:hypothetical protein